MNIGWDIGIKNLSYCILTNDFKITDWGIIDLMDTEEYLCCFKMKNGNICNNNAKKIDKINKNLYCNMHSKTRNNLIDIKFCFLCNKKAKKKDKENNFYCLKHSKNKTDLYLVEPPKKNINFLGTKLIEKLDQNPNLLNVTNIVIENQPALKNPTMKTIQIILYTYYLIKMGSNSYNINMVPANSKLKFDITNPEIVKINEIKNKYKKNKKLSVEFCKEFIKNDTNKWNDYFNTFKKKDDLADAYLLIYHKIKSSV